MRIFSTEEERGELLQRLSDAPESPEIKLAIRVVQEANDFAEICSLVERMFEAYDAPETLERIVASAHVYHEMKPFCAAINELFVNIRLQRFKQFYLDAEENGITYTKPKNISSPKKYTFSKSKKLEQYDKEGFLIL
jgi:hypothetical protein